MDKQTKPPFNYQLGTWQVWTLSDGTIDLDMSLLLKAPVDVMQKELTELGVRYTDQCTVTTDINAYLIKTDKHLILVDTGFGPGMGDTHAQIKACGFELGDITHVLITHLHRDHMCGLLDKEDKRAFSKAKVYVSAIDAAYWRDSKHQNEVPELVADCIEAAVKVLAPYEAARDLVLLEGQEEVVPGIKAIEAFGHTPGHIGFKCTCEGQTLLLWADIVHNIALQTRHPEWAVLVDSDPQKGINSRQKMFKEAASKQWLIGGGHLPYPALGRLTCDGGKYTWQPIT